MSRYTIKAVGSRDPYRPKEWTSSKGGKMISYKLQLLDDRGVEMPGVVELSQKAETPAPKKGDTLDGTIDVSGQYGPKFKKDFSGGSRSGGSPRDDAAIRAQFAIKTAVSLYGGLDADVKAKITDGTAWVEAQAAKFYAMVDRIKAAPASTPPPDTMKQISDDLHQSLTDTFGEDIEDLTDGVGGF